MVYPNEAHRSKAQRESAAIPPPVRESRFVYLRQLDPRDYASIRAEEFSSDTVGLYRSRGRTLPPERWVASLWDGVVLQLGVIERSTDTLAGNVALYDFNQMAGTAKIAALIFHAQRGRGWPLEGVRLFVDLAFHQFPLRKLYMEIFSSNARSLATARSAGFEEEGRLKNHEFVDGAYCDLHIFSLTRPAWEELSAKVSARTAALADAFETVTEDEIAWRLFPDLRASDLDKSFADLGVDSLGVLESLYLLDEMAPEGLPLEIPQGLRSPRDVVHYAQAFLARSEHLHREPRIPR